MRSMNSRIDALEGHLGRDCPTCRRAVLTVKVYDGHDDAPQEPQPAKCPRCKRPLPLPCKVYDGVDLDAV